VKTLSQSTRLAAKIDKDRIIVEEAIEKELDLENSFAAL
jgi:hypothetical protein